MQTSKTIQLRDGNGNFISPATNIESLYYETVGTDENQNIIYRHQLSQNFPVYVNYGNTSPVSSFTVAKVSNASIADISTKSSKLVDNDGHDIIISSYSQRLIKGTNYYALDVSSYNLSVALQSYAGLSYTENRMRDLSTFIQTTYSSALNIINNVFTSIQSNINDLSVNINNLAKDVSILHDSVNSSTNKHDINELKTFVNNNSLVPGHIYTMTYNPNSFLSSTKYFGGEFDIVLLAIDTNKFDENVVACSSANNQNVSKWQVKFDFNKIIDDFDFVTYNGENYEKVNGSVVLNASDNENISKFPPTELYYRSDNGTMIIVLDDDIEPSTWTGGVKDQNGIDISTNGTISAGTYLHILNISEDGNTGVYKKGNGATETYPDIQIIDSKEVLYPSGVITYMKDEKNNEAPFDFKFRKQGNGSYLFTLLQGDAGDISSSNPNVKNNIIKSDSTNIEFRSNGIIMNNFIGYDNTDIYITNGNNNIIGNGNSNISIFSNNNEISNYNSSINLKGSNNQINDNNINVRIAGSFNQIESNTDTITIGKDSKSNIIETSCKSIFIDASCNYNIVGHGSNNVTINYNRGNCTFGPYSVNISTNLSGYYYTYQNIYARSFNTIY